MTGDDVSLFGMTHQFVASILCLVAIFFLASSCGTYNCAEAPGLRISTVALTAVEIDTIVLRKFTKGSGFAKMIDTVSINSHYQIVNDTATTGSFYSTELLYSKYDYEIYIPAINKLTRITDINEPQQKEKKAFLSGNKTYCVNLIVSYLQDGKIINMDDYNNQVFIHK